MEKNEVSAQDIIDVLKEVGIPPVGWERDFYLHNGKIVASDLITSNTIIPPEEGWDYLCTITGDDCNVDNWYTIGKNWHIEGDSKELTEEEREQIDKEMLEHLLDADSDFRDIIQEQLDRNLENEDETQI